MIINYGSDEAVGDSLRPVVEIAMAKSTRSIPCQFLTLGTDNQVHKIDVVGRVKVQHTTR